MNRDEPRRGVASGSRGPQVQSDGAEPDHARAAGGGQGHAGRTVCEAKGIPKISTGDMLREAVKAGTEIGLRAKAIMDRGELVSDEVMIGIVRERLDRDGCAKRVRPRRLSAHGRAGGGARRHDGRARPADRRRHRGAGSGAGAAAGSRLICENCGNERRSVRREGVEPMRCSRCGGQLVQRADDNEAVVLERLKVYQRNTEPLVEYYRDAADVPRRRRRAAAGSRGGGSGRRRWKRPRRAVVRAERRGDCLPVGRRARADARGRTPGRRSADRAGGAGRARRDDGGSRRAGGEADRARRARRRRSRGITGIRRRFARRSTTK